MEINTEFIDISNLELTIETKLQSPTNSSFENQVTPKRFNSSFGKQINIDPIQISTFNSASSASSSSSPCPSLPAIYPSSPKICASPTKSSNSQLQATLVLNSLALIGFNANDYLETYSGIAITLPPLTINIFDRPNDRMLLIILHYMLCILDCNEFQANIKDCWPFLDNKEKNNFKKAVHQSLTRLFNRHIIPRGGYKSTILNLASGFDVWVLLRNLSDACLNILLNYHEQPDASEIDSSLSYSQQSIHDLLTQIQEESMCVKNQITEYINNQQSNSDYLQELDVRLLTAEKQIETTEKQLYAKHLHDEHHILGESGRLKRLQMIKKINKQLDLLQDFSDSNLIHDLHLLLQEELKEYNTLSDREQEQMTRFIHKPILTKEELEKFKSSVRDSMSILITRIEEVSSVI